MSLEILESLITLFAQSYFLRKRLLRQPMVAEKVPDFAAECKIELHHLNFEVYIYHTIIMR